VVSANQPVRIGAARLGIEGDVVDRVSSEYGEFDPTDLLPGGGPRLGELTCDAADLYDRQPAGIGQHDRHLKDDLELVPDRIGREILKRFGAVARLQDERHAVCRPAECIFQAARLAGEDQRGESAQLIFDRRKLGRVGPLRLLPGGSRSPR
jgi:hypothetical protein